MVSDPLAEGRRCRVQQCRTWVFAAPRDSLDGLAESRGRVDILPQRDDGVVLAPEALICGRIPRRTPQRVRDEIGNPGNPRIQCGNFDNVASPRRVSRARAPQPGRTASRLAPDDDFGRARAGASCHRAWRSRGPARPGTVDERAARGFGGATRADKVPCSGVITIAHRRDRVLFAAHLRGSSERRHRGRDDDAR